MKKHNNQKGVSLYLAVVVMVALLSIVLGTSAILARQFKIVRGMENSVVALYAADAGIEVVLKDAYNNIISLNSHYPAGGGTFSLDNGAEYEVNVVCCQDCGGFNPPACNCAWNAAGGNPCLIGVSELACGGKYYCLKSRGYYKETQRAIQVNL